MKKSMVDQLDKYYSSLRKLNRLQSFLRFVTRFFANIILPIYFKVSRKKVNLSQESDVVVSLTSFPQRIDKVWLVIECMLRQSSLPDIIILWLSKDQFVHGLDDIPNSLKYYVDNNCLKIEFVEDDLRSHKKYYYAFKKFPKSKIIVVDDDIFYPSTIIENLIKVHNQYPNVIACLRAYEVTRSSKGEIKPYKYWNKVIEGKGPSLDLFHTSGGGTLYKSDFFDQEVLNVAVFKEVCFTADDVWLNIMAQKSKTMTVKADYFSNLIPIINDSSALSCYNVLESANDLQLNNVLKYYKVDENEVF